MICPTGKALSYPNKKTSSSVAYLWSIKSMHWSIKICQWPALRRFSKLYCVALLQNSISILTLKFRTIGQTVTLLEKFCAPIEDCLELVTNQFSVIDSSRKKDCSWLQTFFKFLYQDFVVHVVSLWYVLLEITIFTKQCCVGQCVHWSQ